MIGSRGFGDVDIMARSMRRSPCKSSRSRNGIVDSDSRCSRRTISDTYTYTLRVCRATCGRTRSGHSGTTAVAYRTKRGSSFIVRIVRTFTRRHA